MMWLTWTVGIVWKYSFNIPMNASLEAQHSEDLGILDEGRLPMHMIISISIQTKGQVMLGY